MQDRYENTSPGLTSPATHAFAITPADNTELPEITRGIYVGGPGNVRAVLRSGADVTFSGLPAGTVLPLRARSIQATGTTATALVGLV
jgi:hypothetical protein